MSSARSRSPGASGSIVPPEANPGRALGPEASANSSGSDLGVSGPSEKYLRGGFSTAARPRESSAVQQANRGAQCFGASTGVVDGSESDGLTFLAVHRGKAGCAKSRGHSTSGRRGIRIVSLRCRARSQVPTPMNPPPTSRRKAPCRQHASMLARSASVDDSGSPGNMTRTAGPQEGVKPCALLWKPG